jgi:ribosomal 30S subunit maturation factor RimM
MGRVSGPYGVKGWIKAKPYSESPEALLDHCRWWLAAGDGSVAMGPRLRLSERQAPALAWPTSRATVGETWAPTPVQ